MKEEEKRIEDVRRGEGLNKRDMVGIMIWKDERKKRMRMKREEMRMKMKVKLNKVEVRIKIEKWVIENLKKIGRLN